MHHGVLLNILQEVQELKRAKQTSLVVFDLDSTLFDLTLRTRRIVEQFGVSSMNRSLFPDECEALKNFANQTTDWDLIPPLKRIGLGTDTPFFLALSAYWTTQFFSNDFLHYDSPLPGASEFVGQINRAGADIMYLSGRHLPKMSEGTLQSLLQHDFPVATANTTTVLKPSADLDDAQFKLARLREVVGSYEKIWFFENEPQILNLISRQIPEIRLVFVDTTHSGKEPLQVKVDRIQRY
jgi:hypothetical protein